MATFSELDWTRLDVFALLAGRGIASVKKEDQPVAAQWLRDLGYRVESLQFAQGISPVVAELGRRLNWEREFGYELPASSRNLDALSEGFEFDVSERGGLVLELSHFGEALREDAVWSCGFLGLLSEHSLHQLALGRRFFAVVLLAQDDSSVVGQQYGELAVPAPFPFSRRAC